MISMKDALRKLTLKITGKKTSKESISEVVDFMANNVNVATLNEAGKVPASQLPSYVDDVIEGYYYDSKFYEDAEHTIEMVAEQGKIYVDLATDYTYRWSGSVYVRINNVDLSNYYTKEEVVANPTLDGTEDDLTGVKIGNTKYKVPQYELPTASANTLGGIKVGSGLEINDGVLSASGGSGGSNKYQHNITLTTTNFGIITFNFIDENSSEKTTASEIYTSLYNLGFYYNTSMSTTDYKYVLASGAYISDNTLIVITGVIHFRGPTQKRIYILTNTSSGINITSDITNIKDNVIAL